MAQVRSEPNLGRCIFTPQPSRQKFKARRTGNLLPMGHSSVSNNTTAFSTNKQHVASTAVVGGKTITASTSDDQPLYVAPTAKMESSQARQDREAKLAYLGKGKGRATSPVSKETPSPVAGNDDATKQAQPLLVSDVVLDSQQQALADAKRYQEEVDRYESQRDREDTDFLDPGSQEGDSQTQEDLFESSRRRSRKTASDSVYSLLQDSVQQQLAGAQPNATKKTPVKEKQLPVQQKPVQKRPAQHTPVQQMPVRQTSVQQIRPILQQQQQQQESRKRKADTEIATERPRLSPSARTATSPNSPNLPTRELRPDQNSQTSDRLRRHRNMRFELCKIESQIRRKEAVKTIKTSWSITEEQLMTLPHAPRIWSEQGLPNQSIMKPLNWNTKLLEALAQLATVTKGDFREACIIADVAFGEFGRPNGAKQLNREILLSALVPQCLEGNNVQATAGISSAQQPANGRRESAPSGSPTETPAVQRRQTPDNTTISKQIPSRPSLIVILRANPRTARSPPLPSTSSVIASPLPPVTPVKSEHVVPIIQQETFDHDNGESLGSEERLSLESRRQILEHELAIVQLRLAIDDRKKKKEQARKFARARQPGGSIGEPLLV